MVEQNKQITIERKKYSNKYLSSKTIVQLRKFCQKKNIPYLGLNKKQIIENIQEWSKGAENIQDYSNKGLKDPDRINPDNHTLNIKTRRFCFLYSTKGTMLTQKQWAKKMDVCSSTITKWLSWKECQDLILTFQENYEKRIIQKFIDEEEEVIDEFLKVIKQKRNSDVKRKAINDFLGYRGRVNINEKGNNTNVRISQKQENAQTNLTQNNLYQITDKMTEEEIDAEIKELENMEG